MKLPLFQIDAFSSKPFQGNPAAICPLKKWLPDEVMQSIAEENNLSETAFFVPTMQGFHIRWFTPVAEVNLCGHATLAAAYVLFNFLEYKEQTIQFDSRSGVLEVSKSDDLLIMNFPAQTPVECDISSEIEKAFGVTPEKCLKAEDYIAIFKNEADIISMKPKQAILKELNLRGVIISSKSEKYDFVARFFAPKYGINEDPVTGSAYTQLAPYWSKELGIARLRAKQLSSRGGELFCEVKKDRVEISGKAVRYMQGEIRI